MSKKCIKDELIQEAGNAMLVQNHQKKSVEKQLFKIESALNNLTEINIENTENLDDLIAKAEMVCEQQGIDTSNYEMHVNDIEPLSLKEKEQIKVDEIDMIETIEIDKYTSWKEYMLNINQYASVNNIDLSKSSFEKLLTEQDRIELAKNINEDYKLKSANCDKFDYLIAAFCGVATGLIDVFFVGKPGESKLGEWTDKKVDNLVKKFAQSIWKSDKKNGITKSTSKPEGIASAIGYLERRFKVNYDARYAADLNLCNDDFNMNPKNHHFKSLAHAPDLIGLFFSILDQFTGKNTFISNGKIIRLEPVENKFELRGSSFISKLFCGFSNWLGHIMSDIAGSSGTRGHLKNRRGAGVTIPFFEMFQLCNFGSFNVKEEQKNLAELSVKIFEAGYDARHGLTTSIPVVINEIMIRLLWSIKSRFYHNRSWKESTPNGSKPELRRMLLVGHGSLCLIDGIDAGLRSGGQILEFSLHLNYIAWSRFAFAGLQEIRSLCTNNNLDILAMDEDLEIEWNKLYKQQYV